MALFHAKKLFFFLVAVILFPSPVSATTYYVSNSGSNSNPGTINWPLKTIAFAESKMAGGDIIYLRGGIYKEAVSIYGVTGGTELKRTTISAYNNEIVIIDGTGINVGAGNGLVRSFNTYTQFIGLIVRNSDQYGITLDGNNAAHSIVSHCTVYNCMQTGIGGYADNCITEYCTVYNTALANEGGTLSVGWASGITCSGNSSRPTNGCIIRHNIVYDIWGEGISTFEATHSTIEDNTARDFYSVGIYVSDATDCLVQRNLVYRTKNMANGSQVGIGHWNEKFNPANKNNTFINNIVYGCKINFYHGNAMEGLLVANNTFMNSVYSECVRINDDDQISGEFRNNLIIQEDALQCIDFVKDPDVIFSNNLYNKSYDTDARGAGDIIGDPKLAKTGDPGTDKLTAEYFKLLSASPAIDKGIVLNEVSQDFFGNARDAFPDIGANEYYAVEPSIKVTEIKVTGAGDSNIVAAGATLQLIATVSPSNASNKTVSWLVTNFSGQATISSSGLLTAVSPGIVNVNALAQDGSGISGTFEITIALPNGHLSQMIIYPNPALNHFTFLLNQPITNHLSIKIFDLSGKILLENKIESDWQEVIIPKSFANGIYIVNICSDKLIYDTQKLIIQN